MLNNKFIIAGIIIVGILAFFAYDNSKNKTDNISDVNEEYLLSLPNMGFEITFPTEPEFNRTDGEDFTRHSWSYIDDTTLGNRNALFIQAENNLYAYNSSQENFIEEVARLYSGVVVRMEKDSNAPATDYEISSEDQTIVGRIVDIGEWTFVISNHFEQSNSHPDFISSFRNLE
ncbi:hypothetical protein K2X96_01540 [Patescibacteria group bacterium]|nr:hypothetical protein [Patescibacteria group bacterium]